MQKITFGLLTGAAILAATALAYAQSASPIEGNPSAVRPAPPVSGTVPFGCVAGTLARAAHFEGHYLPLPSYGDAATATPDTPPARPGRSGARP